MKGNMGCLFVVFICGIMGSFLIWAGVPDLGWLIFHLSLVVVFLVPLVVLRGLAHALAGVALGGRVFKIILGSGHTLLKHRWGEVVFQVNSSPFGEGIWLVFANRRLIQTAVPRYPGWTFSQWGFACRPLALVLASRVLSKGPGFRFFPRHGIPGLKCLPLCK